MSTSQHQAINVGILKTDVLQHLKFKLYPDTSAMLPIEQITEVIKLQLVQITPIPQMPSWVMGVHNWRGDILWMVDLGQLVGFDSCYRHQHNRTSHAAIVLCPNRQAQNEHKIHLGLLVAGVEDLENCEPRAIQAAAGLKTNSQLASFIKGYWSKPSGEIVFALDGQAIAAAMANCQ